MPSAIYSIGFSLYPDFLLRMRPVASVRLDSAGRSCNPLVWLLEPARWRDPTVLSLAVHQMFPSRTLLGDLGSVRVLFSSHHVRLGSLRLSPLLSSRTLVSPIFLLPPLSSPPIVYLPVPTHAI